MSSKWSTFSAVVSPCLACWLLPDLMFDSSACSFFKAKNWWANFARRYRKTYNKVSLNRLLVSLCQNPELLSSFATRELLQFPLGVTVFLSLCAQILQEQSLVATFRVLYLIYPHRHFLYKESLFLSFSNQLSQDGQTVTVGPVGSRWWLGWNFWWRGSRSEIKTSWRWIKRSYNKSIV